MAEAAKYIDIVAFAVLPYVAVVLFLVVTIQRYVTGPFSYSSLSSQFLENREHFWGLVPLHVGLLVVLAGHVVAFLIPAQILWWNSRPLRLYVLEGSALAFGLLTLIGLASSIHRRMTVPRVRIVTSVTDWMVLFLLLLQVFAGIHVAVLHRWGSSWFAAAIAPYLWSLVELRPDLSTITELPLSVKLHMFGGYLLIAFAPFTRIVHALVAPLPYLWRRPQLVRWYGRATRRMEGSRVTMKKT